MNTCNGHIVVEVAPFDPAREHIHRIAANIRKAFLKARDTAYVDKMILLTELSASKAVSEGKTFDWTQKGTIILNNLTKCVRE